MISLCCFVGKKVGSVFPPHDPDNFIEPACCPHESDLFIRPAFSKDFNLYPAKKIWSVFSLDRLVAKRIVSIKIILQMVTISSIKHDLARSCFQLWPKIGDEGEKISRKKVARR